MPLAATYFTFSTAQENTNIALSAALEELFGRGQMYLMAYGLFGTIFWLAYLNPIKERHNARAFLGFIATLLIMPVVGFLGLDPTFSSVANAEVVWLGYYSYGAFAIIYYLLIFFSEIEPPSPSDVLASETDDLIASYGRLSSE